MSETSVLRHRFLAGLFSLAAVCAGLSVLRAWLPAREPGMPFYGWLICCAVHDDTGAMSREPFVAPTIAAGLIVLGAAILLAHVIQVRFRIARLFRVAPARAPSDQLAALLAGLHLDGPVHVIDSVEPFAFCFGFFRPHICLSSALAGMLSPEELEAVLLHEDHHRRRHDPLRILFLEVLANTLFFLPTVREWVEMIRIRMEVNADRYAVSVTGRPALAGALHRMLAAGPKRQPFGTAAIVTGFNAVAPRVAALLGEQEISIGFSESGLVRSALSLGVLCVVLMF